MSNLKLMSNSKRRVYFNFRSVPRERSMAMLMVKFKSSSQVMPDDLQSNLHIGILVGMFKDITNSTNDIIVQGKTNHPTKQSTNQSEPTIQPYDQPTKKPTSQPTSQPTKEPTSKSQINQRNSYSPNQPTDQLAIRLCNIFRVVNIP